MTTESSRQRRVGVCNQGGEGCQRAVETRDK
jgi:hypothetical protein